MKFVKNETCYDLGDWMFINDIATNEFNLTYLETCWIISGKEPNNFWTCCKGI